MTALSQPLQHLPLPDAEAAAVSSELQAHMAEEIARTGFMPFDRFMELALYAPGLGYYAGGATKFGGAGDFVTAPRISPLFGQSLAAQLAQLIEWGLDSILELGAGDGRLAADVLSELARLGRLPRRYAILEISAELRSRQHSTLAQAVPGWVDRVEWLDRLPSAIEGVVFANEVLDALPVNLVTWRGGRILELGVERDPHRGEFTWAARPAAGELLRTAGELNLPDDYRTEVQLAARGLVRSLADSLQRGVLLCIDYGFPRREYYHPQRSGGTLMCHYRHHAHADPLCLVGLQDITSHLDFSALANAATESGLDLAGYSSQARFLINCGVLDRLAALDPQDTARYAPACAAVQRLLNPAEMGELFKVIAFGRSVSGPLLGFRSGDRRAAL